MGSKSCDTYEKAHKDIELTEDWIRERLNLDRERLDNVKALSLPGTYHEKVVTIGKSLLRFTRLKELDLSRNSISKLHGLEHLTILESLNLYYNQIESLDELKFLRHNTNIKRIDLRLNPVSKQVADYRQLLISFLPNLEYLDDRPIKDAERLEASQRFSNLIRRNDDQSDSTKRVPDNRKSRVSEYKPSEIQKLLIDEIKSDESDSSDYHHKTFQKSRNNHQSGQSRSKSKTRYDYQARDYVTQSPSCASESHLKGCYVTFTPSPTYSSSSGRSNDSEHFVYQSRKPTKFANEEKSNNGKVSKEFKDAESQFSAQLINLVEQFWEGPKSLEDSPTFMAMLKSTFRDYTRKFITENKRVISQQQQQIDGLGLENAQLSERLREIKASQESELVTLRAKVNQLEDQLRYEQSQRSTVEKMKRKTDEELIDMKHQFSEYQLQAKCQNLTQRSKVNSEVNQLRSELGRYRKLEETVAALKDNQSKLTRTNEHLSQELSMMRSQQMISSLKDSNMSNFSPTLLHT
ncbi:uncharacterized protein LOC142337835 [Convolutriloba macropyga]|uniref:uncharacterized protein LOC142337835 n=1 Tax=Convolutriloba macropyga TaxID=536237 RepID=UPI003F522044